MALRNPILFFIVTAFVTVNIIDGITAFFILPGEAHPVFIFTNNVFIIDIYKIIFIITIIYFYRRNIYPSNFWFFFFVMALVLGTLLVSMGALSNIAGIRNPKLVQEASKMSVSEKVSGYFRLVTFLYWLPFIFTVVGFKLYEWSLKHTKIDAEYYRKKKWWQL